MLDLGRSGRGDHMLEDLACVIGGLQQAGHVRGVRGPDGGGVMFQLGEVEQT